MDKWKSEMKEFTKYCKEDRQGLWTSDIDALDISTYEGLGDANLIQYTYDSQKNSFIKTAEIMKALDEGASWEDIGALLMEGHKYCQYPAGVIAHMMLKYSKHGIEFVQKSFGDSIDLFPELEKEFNEELEKQNKKTLE